MLQNCVLKCNTILTISPFLLYYTQLRTKEEDPNDKKRPQDRHKHTLNYCVKTEGQSEVNLYKYKVAQQMSLFGMTKEPILQA